METICLHDKGSHGNFIAIGCCCALGKDIRNSEFNLTVKVII